MSEVHLSKLTHEKSSLDTVMQDVVVARTHVRSEAIVKQRILWVVIRANYPTSLRYRVTHSQLTNGRIKMPI